VGNSKVGEGIEKADKKLLNSLIKIANSKKKSLVLFYGAPELECAFTNLPLWRGMAHCRGDLPKSSRRPTCATTRPPIP
jgi:hypothetical protein